MTRNFSHPLIFSSTPWKLKDIYIFFSSREFQRPVMNISKHFGLSVPRTRCSIEPTTYNYFWLDRRFFSSDNNTISPTHKKRNYFIFSARVLYKLISHSCKVGNSLITLMPLKRLTTCVRLRYVKRRNDTCGHNITEVT